MKKDFQFVIRNLKALTKKAEAMARKVDRLENAVAKKAKPKPRVKAEALRRGVTKKAAAKKPKRVTATDTVMAIINRSKKGVDTATLVQKTGFNEIKVRNIVFRLKKQKKIKSKTKGVYVKI